MEAHPEHVIEQLGGCGRYQILLSAVIHLMKFSAAFNMQVLFFSNIVPDFWCDDELDGMLQNSTFNMTAVNTSHQPALRSCSHLNGTTCRTIRYDQSVTTTVNEWNLACSLSWVPALVGSLQMAGLLVGNFISGQLADTLGRKKPLFWALILLIIANLIGYFSTSWIMFAAARTISGIGTGCYFTVQYSILLEMSTSWWRPWVVAIPSWSAEACVFALVAYLVPDWRNLQLITLLLAVPFLACWWIVPESFRWHISHDDDVEARKILRRIATINRKPYQENLTRGLLCEEEKRKAITIPKYTVIDLFRSKELIKRTLLSLLNWFALGIITYSIQFGIQAWSGSFYLNLFLFNALSIPAQIIAVVASNCMGRRLTTIICFFILTTGALAVGIVQLTVSDPDLKGTLTNVFALTAGVGFSIAWGPLQVMTLELFPTVIRNISYGSMNTFARVGSILGPQLAYLDTLVAGIMYFVSGLFGLCCIIGTAALTDTKDVLMDDKITHGNPDLSVAKLESDGESKI